MKLKTATGKEIECQYDGNINEVIAEYESQSSAFEDCCSLTDEALSTVEFVEGKQVVATYHDIKKIRTEIMDEDGKIVAHFHFEEMSALELAIRTLQEEMIEVQEALVEG